MNRAKIHLSKQESDLVNNREWLLTKQVIIKKVYDVFGELHRQYKIIAASETKHLPNGLLVSGGKISRGENYKGLPYIVLDYPAVFTKENVFAVRTLFWWGNYFSISLLLSGKYFPEIEKGSAILNYLQEKNFLICNNESPWEHSIDEGSYLEAGQITGEQMTQIMQKNYFKIAKKISLEQWEGAPVFLENSFREMIQSAAISFHQDGETDL